MTAGTERSAAVQWSSRLAFSLGVAGAAVGLGSIWRFPYLAGSGGGAAFIIVFILACLLIATPLLVAEFALGRRSRLSPPQAAGEVARQGNVGRGWNAIGVLGTLAAFLIVSYYMVIAAWVLAYTWKCAAGVLAAAGPARVGALWPEFLSRPLEVGAWHLAFVALAACISARGLNRGIEWADKIRGPGLLLLLLVLVAYSLATADVQRGLTFAFRPDFSALNAEVVLTAIGQAFYATGVGQAMMIAYGAYVPAGTSLVRTSLGITAAILLVSLLATLIVFPLVFAYGVNPAQGSQLVFEVLPRVFTEMPAGRLIGTLFFLLLVLAALMPSIASLEPVVAWLVQRFAFSRVRAVLVTTGAAWLLGIGSVLSFNVLADWHPLALIPSFETRTFFDAMDYASSNILLPLGALMTSLFVGWRVSQMIAEKDLAESSPAARKICIWLLRYLCPIAIVAVSLAAVAEAGEREPMSASVYARAERLLPPVVTKLVRNAHVVPHWIGASDQFWYERQLESGHEFVLMDAATGKRKPAFDHERVARELAAASGKPATAHDLPFKSFTFNADRSTIVFTVGDSEYTVPLISGSTQVRPVTPPTPEAIVSPDGRWSVMSRSGNLHVRELATGTERALTTDGEPDAGYGIWPDGFYTNFVPRAVSPSADPPPGLRWSPDSARIFVPYFDQRHVQPYPMLDSAPKNGALRPRLFQPRLALVGEKPATVEWFIVDVATGNKRKVALPKLLDMQADILPIGDVWWRKDGARLYAVANGDNMESAFLFEIDAATGTARAVITDVVLPRTDLNTTTYNLPNVWVSDDGRDAIWFSQRDGWGRLYIYDVASGKLRNRLTRGDWLVRDLIRVDQAARVVYFTASGREAGNPYHRRLYRVNFDGTGLQLLTPEAADHSLLPARGLVYNPDGIPWHEAVSPSGRYFVDNYSTVTQPPKSAVRSTRDGRLVGLIEEADATALFAQGWRVPEEVTTTAADGKTQIHSVLYTPSDLDAARKYPVLDAQYASPLISVAPRNFYQSLSQSPGLDQAAYAELGFVVITVDGRGTTNRSKDFSQVMYGKLNTNGLEDHVAAIRQLAAQRSYMDADRVGLFGVSYGGYMTIRGMLEFPEFYEAGISTAGIAVMPGMYADYHWSAFQGRGNWDALDARKQVERLRGKLYLQLSELDENVLPGQTLTFIDALIAAGKPFEMLYLPSRDHFLLSEPYPLQRNWDFMVRHLQGREPPADFRIKVSGR